MASPEGPRAVIRQTEGLAVLRTLELCSGCGCGFQEAECWVTGIMKECPGVSFQSEGRRKPCGRTLTSCHQLAFSVTCTHHVSPSSAAAIGACPPARSQAWPALPPPRSPLRRAVLLLTGPGHPHPVSPQLLSLFERKLKASSLCSWVVSHRVFPVSRVGPRPGRTPDPQGSGWSSSSIPGARPQALACPAPYCPTQLGSLGFGVPGGASRVLRSESP